MKKKHLTIGTSAGIAAILLILGFGCASSQDVVSTDDNGEVVVDRDAILLEAMENGLIMDEEEIGAMSGAQMVTDAGESPSDTSTYLSEDFSGWSSAALADVTGGSSFGLAHSTFENGSYMLVAEFGSLPVPGSGYFYEGWIVRRGEDLSVVSTGPAEILEDTYINIFTSSTDYSDHDFYVLTLEPDDGNTAPDEHILEGTLK